MHRRLLMCTWVLVGCGTVQTRPTTSPLGPPALQAPTATVNTRPGAPGRQEGLSDRRTVDVVIDDQFIATHDAQDVLDPVWWTGDIYGTVDEYAHSLRLFSREQRFLFAVAWYLGEVNNGGHDQFYWNSTGIVWPDALAGLEEIGAMELASLLRESTSRLGGSPARDRATRQAQLDRFHPSFNDIDDRFYLLETDPSIDDMMTSYVRAHASAFRFRGTVVKSASAR